MRCPAVARSARRGYTLIELLVVLLIAGLLIATALPIAATMLDDARVREGSRALNAFFAMAKSRAAATGRPCGLLLVAEPVSGTSYYQATQVYMAEMAEPYGGSSLSPVSKAKINSTTNMLEFWSWDSSISDYAHDTTDEPAYMQAMLGTTPQTILIRFDFKGDWFRVYYDGSTYTYQGSLLGTTVPPGDARPFQILREPRSVGTAREMPRGTAVDLLWSGYGPGNKTLGDDRGAGNFFRNASKGVLVMFSPAGGVDGVFIDGVGIPQQGTLHFLVGRAEQTGMVGAGSNLADPTSLWVSVGRSSGIAMTTENTPNDPTHVDAAGNDPTNPFLSVCRGVASSRQQMKGR